MDIFKVGWVIAINNKNEIGSSNAEGVQLSDKIESH